MPNRRQKSLLKKIALRENSTADALPLNAGSVSECYIVALVRDHCDKGSRGRSPLGQQFMAPWRHHDDDDDVGQQFTAPLSRTRMSAQR